LEKPQLRAKSRPAVTIDCGWENAAVPSNCIDDFIGSHLPDPMGGVISNEEIAGRIE
jgi:hypothetical protein